MRNGVTFWTEGGSPIGMGHVVRCINTARAVERLGLPVSFLVNNDKIVIEKLNSLGICYTVYPVDGFHPLALAGDIVVIDSKKDLRRQAGVLKDDGRTVVVIDNLSACDRADAVVMPSAIHKNEPPSCNVYAGSEYAIIGENFHAAKSTLEVRGPSPALRVLVTMGGADPFRLTEKVVKALWNAGGVELTVVIGPALKPSHELRILMGEGDGRIRFLQNVKDMAPVMHCADIAITAVGTTVYELAFMGVPSILIGNYIEDRADMAALEKLGICTSLGHFRDASPEGIAAAVESMQDRARRAMMSKKAASLLDGRGASRIAAIIETLARGSSGGGEELKNISDGGRHA